MSKEMSISKIDAILEVYIDHIKASQKLENYDKVLLWIFEQDMSEVSVCIANDWLCCV